MNKYIIFLPDIIFSVKKCFYKCSKYIKLIKSLEKNGIDIIGETNKNSWINNINIKNNINLSFDYERQPELNKLYIYLCGSLYFSDDNYSRYRLNLEKELLLLLCGYLGGKKVSVITNNIDLKEQKISTDVNLNNNSNNIDISNTNKNHFTNKIKEIYTLETKNLLFEKDKNEFEIKLFEKLIKINEDFVEYYKICLKLQIFTSKRFDLRMCHYSYQLEEEFKNEKIIQVKTLLYNYGIGLQYINTNQIINSYLYDIIFYKNDELFFYHERNLKCEKDIFCKLKNEYEIDKKIMKRDFYENWGGETNAIYEEVIKFAERNNIKDKLDKWFANEHNNYSKLMGDCHWFNSEIYVKKWLNEHIKDCNLI
jgi:hypothetical protein